MCIKNDSLMSIKLCSNVSIRHFVRYVFWNWGRQITNSCHIYKSSILSLSLSIIFIHTVASSIWIHWWIYGVVCFEKNLGPVIKTWHQFQGIKDPQGCDEKTGQFFRLVFQEDRPLRTILLELGPLIKTRHHFFKTIEYSRCNRFRFILPQATTK